jgi:RimJ/RimL family protein N-acetyltransferase
MRSIDLTKIAHRTCNSGDAREHFCAVQESYEEVSAYLPDFLPMKDWTVERHKQYLSNMACDRQGIKNYLFFYEDQIVGGGHLKPAAWKHSGELLYWVRTGWDGLGIGEHIARTMTNYSNKFLGYRYVIIETNRENVASRRIAEKLGFSLAMVYGHIDHHGRQTNMAVWLKEAPMTKTMARFDPSYQFDPVALFMPMRYRYVTQEVANAYLKPSLAGDPQEHKQT